MKILDTGFGNGARFLRFWADWKADSQPFRALHYVAIVQNPIDLHALKTGHTYLPSAQTLADELGAQCWGLLPGFHRLIFENGQVLLTLCVGDLKAQTKALAFQADALHLAAPACADDSPRDLWDVKALARCCRQGTEVTCEALSPDLWGHLRQCGFEMAAPDASGFATGHYAPRWALKNKLPASAAAPSPSHATAVVLGAGLAGASLAASLARRGWQVTVLDAAEQPASGASGLPVGLMVPHVTIDDDPRSRLSRNGLRLTLQEARMLLVKGQDWDDCGVLERRLDTSHGLPMQWPQEGAVWSSASHQSSGPWRAGLPDNDVALWHSRGAWVKPASLVNAWLAQPGIQFRGKSCVASIHQINGQWVLKDAANQELARAGLVVLANAGGTIPLLRRLSELLPEEAGLARAVGLLQTVEGQVSWAIQDPADTHSLPPFPMNGLGSLIGNIPFEGAKAWFVGATFEREGDVLDVPNGHIANLQRVETLLPASGRLFAHQLHNQKVLAWRNTRCTATDRMPVCGPLTGETNPGLWISTAMGARGLSLTVLCAELLAARLCGEPWPIEVKLAQSLDSMRKIH